MATDLIAAAAWERGQVLALPAWRTEAGAYAMARWTAETRLAPGRYGILEPAEPEWLAVPSLQVMLVPCLAFAPDGRRLGHGGGHFDRLLDGFPGLIIALAWEAQKLEVIPVEGHDIPVHLVITERAVYRATAGRTGTPS